MEIKHENNCFYIGEDFDSAVAYLKYTNDDNSLIIDCTYVAPELRGQDLGKELVYEFAKYARENTKKIIPVCSFARHVLEMTKEYEDVLE